MDRGDLPAAARGHRGRRHGKRPAGLHVVDRDGTWHIHGTERVAGVDGRIRSFRIRRGTGLPATTDNKPAAEALRSQWALDLRNQVIYGVKPSAPLPVAAEQFLARTRKNGRMAGAREIEVVKDITRRFGATLIADISEKDWIGFVEDRNVGNAAATRERYLNVVVSFLNWCEARPRKWISELPAFERNQAARKPRHRQRRRVAELRPELIALFIENAGWHLKPQLWVEWSTGARVSSVLHAVRLCDVILAPGREQITFGMTKNGEPVTAALHPEAAEAVRDYLKRRGRLHDREGALFLRKDGQPYTENGLSGQNRTAFDNTKARTVRALRRQALAIALELRRTNRHDEARQVIGQAWADIVLVRQVTQHWFRHLLATAYLAKGLLRAGMEQGGWLDVKSIMGYAHDVPDIRRQTVLDMPVPKRASGSNG